VRVASPSPPLVQIEGLWKQYRRIHDRPARIKDAFLARVMGRVHQVAETWAVRDVSLSVSGGEAVGLIGPNGSGKTTVLSVIAHVLRPTRGSVQVRGRVCPLLGAGAAFHRDLTGLENVYLSGAILGMSRRDIDAKLDDIVAFAQAEEYLDTPVRTYSSGMVMRLGFAVAVHMEPEVLVVDEILAAGDEAFRAKVRERLRGEVENGKAVLFVSHYMEEVRLVCDRALWMADGQIVRGGPTDEVVDHYVAQGGGQ
jgi:lipopolysaccharide transport system ATP-binding protein